MPISKEYMEAIKKLAENKQNKRFLNDSGDHAKLLIDYMIGKSKANDEVLIYSGELKSEFYMDALLAAKAQIRVLLDKKDGLSVVDNLPPENKNRIQARIVSEKGKNHFFVAGSSLRYELDHDAATAVGNFNEEKDVLDEIKSRFNKMWESAIN